MKKSFLLLILFFICYTSFAQGVVVMTNPVSNNPSAPNYNKQVNQFANLSALLTFNIPYGNGFTLNNANAKPGQLYFDTSSRRMGVFNGTSFDTLSTSVTSSYLAGFGLKLNGNSFEVDTAVIRTVSNSYNKTQIKALMTSVSIKQFGAKGDGTTDDTDAFLLAASTFDTSKVKSLYIPKGTFKVSRPIIFPAGTSIFGVGAESVIDASQADSTNFPAPVNQIRSSVITISGDEPVQVGITSVKPVFGDNSITLNSSASLNEGDILLLTDTAAYSYSLFRPEYKQGETVRVSTDVSGTTVNLEGRITANLYKNNPLVYKMYKAEGHVAGIKILAPNDGRSEITALRFEYITNGTIEDFYGSNSNYGILSINDCTNILINKAFLNKSIPDISGTSYGIIIGDSEDITVTNSEMYATRHGLTTGGGGKYTIVTRRVKAYNSVFYAHGGVASFDFHGNTEYSGVFNSKLDGGLTLAGRRNTATGNTIMQDITGNETAINFAEIIEPTFEINSNLIYSYKPTTSGGMWLRMQGTNNTEFSGLLSVHDNMFNFVNKQGLTMFYSGLLVNYVGSLTNPINVSIKNNQFTIVDAVANSTTAVSIGLTNVSSPYSSVQLQGNILYGGNIEVNGGKKVSIFNNSIYNTIYHGINLRNSSGEISYNKTYNTNIANSGSSTTNTAILASTNSKISINDNFGSKGAFTSYGVSVNGADTLVLSNNKHSFSVREYNFLSVGLYEFDILSHNLAPNSNIAAKTGSVYIQDIGSSGNVLWTKITGTGNTGWDQVTTSTNTATLTNKSFTSPVMTGTPTAPTAASGNNTTQVSTTAFVQAALAAGGYVPATRTLTAGIGLSGGGDLSANRTFIVDTTTIRTVANSLTLAQMQAKYALKNNGTINTPTILNGTANNMIIGNGAPTAGTFTILKATSAPTSGTDVIRAQDTTSLSNRIVAISDTTASLYRTKLNSLTLAQTQTKLDTKQNLITSSTDLSTRSITSSGFGSFVGTVTGQQLRVNGSGFLGSILGSNLTAATVFQLPNTGGTFALTSDITGKANLSGGNTFSGIQVFTSPMRYIASPNSIYTEITKTNLGSNSVGSIALNLSKDDGTGIVYGGSLTGSQSMSGTRTWELPDASGKLQLIPILDNTFTTTQSSASLNTAYPSAVIGQQITAPNVGSGMKYEKVSTTGGGTWIAWIVSGI